MWPAAKFKATAKGFFPKVTRYPVPEVATALENDISLLRIVVSVPKL